MISDILTNQITQIETQITNINTAINALTLENITTYTMDTGQSRVVVTRRDIVRLTKLRDSLLNSLSVLDARTTGSGSIQGAPAF